MPIITSLLDTDLYKLTMQQAFFEVCPQSVGKYLFKCRNKEANLLPLKMKINHELDLLCELQYQDYEIDYLRTLGCFKDSFLTFLKDFKLKREHIVVSEKYGFLDIECNGPIIYTSPFEIYVLKIVHELYSREYNDDIYSYVNNYDYLGNEYGLDQLESKTKLILDSGIKVVDFGTRRAFSGVWHDFVVEEMKEVLAGTSNLMLAKKHNLKPIGTFAHEWVQVFQGLKCVRLEDSQKVAFQKWMDVYDGQLGIALSDTLGTDKFLKDFNKYFANMFDGIRHDSGCPFKWTKKIYKHCQSLGIDTNTKTIVYSDGLDVPKAIELNNKFGGLFNVVFGIGTNLTNDLGVPALQNVMKLVEVDGNPVAKLSDDSGKTMCNDMDYLNYLRKVI